MQTTMPRCKDSPCVLLLTLVVTASAATIGASGGAVSQYCDMMAGTTCMAALPTDTTPCQTLQAEQAAAVSCLEKVLVGCGPVQMQALYTMLDALIAQVNATCITSGPGIPEVTDVIVWRRAYDERYLYNTDVDTAPSPDFEKLSGESSAKGTVGYVRGYSRPYMQGNSTGHHTTRLNLCWLTQADQTNFNLHAYQLLWLGACQNLKRHTTWPGWARVSSEPSLSVYVSTVRHENEAVHNFRLSLCKDGDGLIYSVLSYSCPMNSTKITEKEFYAYGGDIFCPDLSSVFQHGTVYEQKRPDKVRQEKAHFSCNTGYTMSGKSQLQCGSNGLWEGEIPHCNPVECGAPSQLLHGTWNGTSSVYQSEMRLQCDPAYELTSEDDVIECEATGSWSAIRVECAPRSCGQPTSPTCCVLHGNDYTYGSTVEWWCDHDFFVEGNTEAQCLENGTWSSEPPTCKAVDCGPPSEVPSGNWTGSDFGYQGQVRLECEEGYRLSSANNIITCGSSGNWSEVYFECEVITCGPLPTCCLSYAAFAGSSVGRTVRQQCSPGRSSYASYDPNYFTHLDNRQYSAICDENGTWTWTGAQPLNCT